MKNFVVGIVITIVSWIIAWGKLTFLSEHTFFPLWLGYIFTINGLSEILFAKSLLLKLKNKSILLFLISIPFWWLFELFNFFTQNWQYILPRPVGILEYTIRASLNFSTVIPAVLSTTYLFHNIITKVVKIKPKKLKIQEFHLSFLFILGFLSLFLIYRFPKVSFPLLWITLLFILEPINYRLGFHSLLRKTSQDFTLPISIGFATLFTGFFWEMWNFYSIPKWIYSIPYLEIYKIFEMPIFGYLGYPLFGLEVYSFSVFCIGMLHKLGFSPKINHFMEEETTGINSRNRNPHPNNQATLQ